MTDFNKWMREGLREGFFERALREMHHPQKLFKLVKDEMQRRGNWKKAPTGRPFQKGFDPNRKILKPAINKKSPDLEDRRSGTGQ